MPLPYFFHIGNAGGNSFFGAIGAFPVKDDVLILNLPSEVEALRPRLTPEYVARLSLVLGHGVHYADDLIPNRYNMTMLRWPRAQFNANVVYYHENPGLVEHQHLFDVADPYERLRGYLGHLESGGAPDLRMTAFDWLNERHGLGCEPRTKRAERMARLDDFDAVLRDRYDLVAICELMDESLFLFQADFPDRRIIPWLRSTVNKKRIDAFTMPRDIVERFEHEHAPDIALYDRARQRLLDRFAVFWRTRPDMHDSYLIYKSAMVLTDPLLKSRFEANDPLYFPVDLPLEQLRARVMALLPRAEEIRTRMWRAYG